ncbi:hypothetical protein ABMX48_37110 [Streptomyces cavourensis]
MPGVLPGVEPGDVQGGRGGVGGHAPGAAPYPAPSRTGRVGRLARHHDVRDGRTAIGAPGGQDGRGVVIVGLTFHRE